MDPEILKTIIEVFGVGGILALTVRYLGLKLAKQYEARIEALESASDRCEVDRVDLRNQLTAVLLDQLDLKKKLMSD